MQQKQITHLEFSAPVKVISEANNFDHWTKKAKRKNAQQLEILVVMQNALAGRSIRLPCKVRLVHIGPKKLDPDNLANGFKAVQDQIAAKLGVDDGDEEKVTWTYDQEPCRVRRYSVRVQINSKLPPALEL